MAKGYGVLSPGGVDTEAPTAPGSFAGTALSATRVSLTWTASTDNIGVTGYQVFRNGSPLTTVTGLSFTDTGLTPATQYSYTITAYDAAGNNSGLAGPALVTTLTNSAPVWSIGNQSFNNGTAVNISLDAFCSDADGDPITYSLVSGTLPTGLALSGARNQTLSGTVTADGAFNFTLGASDGIAATQTVALTFTVSTPDVIPPDPPSAPTILTFTSSTITLTLPVSAASDHASYTIQRSTNGTDYGTRATGITTATWQDTGLNASTAYWYRLIDVDTSANASSPGSAVSQTTAEANDGSNASRIAAILGSYTIPFSYDTPADPVITSEATVTTSTFSANNVNGRRVTLSAGDYGNISLSGSDKDLVIQDGVVINTLSITSGNRIRVRGASPRVGVVRQFTLSEGGTAPNDVLIDGINMEGGNARVYLGAQRAAVINSRLDVGTGSFAASSFNGLWNNIIVANCEMLAPGTGDAVTRMQSPQTIVWVRNRVAGGPSAVYNTFRLHADGGTVDNAYIAGNQFEGTRLALTAQCCGIPHPYLLTNVWFEDNNFYMTNGNTAFINTSDTFGGTDHIVFLSLKRNNGYGPASVWIQGSPWTGRGYEVEDNTIAAYQSPPAWSFA